MGEVLSFGDSDREVWNQFKSLLTVLPLSKLLVCVLEFASLSRCFSLVVDESHSGDSDVWLFDLKRKTACS